MTTPGLRLVEKLLSAAEVISRNSQALPLRYLQILADISTQKTSNTIIFPLPMEMMTSFLKRDEEK